jgi:FtsP/CotA-like multicopper oxidase with cupredoxin domain
MNVVSPRRLAAHTLSLFLAFVGIANVSPATATPNAPLPEIRPNDNRHAAGTLDGSTLTLALRAARGRWQPEGPAGPALEVEAFGEVGGGLTVPAPLMRVAEGTTIVATVRNELDATLAVHGLCARDSGPCATLEVPAGQTREVRFASGAAGTYHYWASTFGAPIPFRELAGAFIVDPPNGEAEPDRVMVITEWSNLTGRQLGEIFSADVPTEMFLKLKPRVTMLINGLSWPATERFTYELGERVKWRVINLSSQVHPMHLHGFYFEVRSLGDGMRDTVLPSAHPRRVVTQVIPPAGTMTMTWTPERAGNWLFHCHVMHHVSLDRKIAPVDPAAHHLAGGHAGHAVGDPSLGMAGMVIGVTVRSPTATPAPPPSAGSPRRLTLVMQKAAGQHGDVAAAGFILSEGSASPSAANAESPGPPIVLRRDEPVEITLVNRLTEATAIHWHGLELDSYYDGVHGWSGAGRRVTPMIEPGASFVVRLTPPRAGTFIYHTHLHDFRQLSSGLYGPLVVTNPGETFDPALDHVIVLGRRGLSTEVASVLGDPESVVMNGQREPRFVWAAGTKHRVRLVNITADDIYQVTLQTNDGPVRWTPIAKDGAPLPPAESVEGAARQTIAVGETYDFEYQAPPGRKTAWLEVRTTGGKWQVQGQVIIKP